MAICFWSVVIFVCLLYRSLRDRHLLDCDYFHRLCSALQCDLGRHTCNSLWDRQDLLWLFLDLK